MKFILPGLVAMISVGCASSTYTPTAVCTGSSGAVRVLASAPAEGTYKVCGSVSIAAGGLSSYEAAIDGAREEAAKYGANAIIVVRRPDAECSVAKGCVREGTALAVQTR